MLSSLRPTPRTPKRASRYMRRVACGLQHCPKLQHRLRPGLFPSPICTLCDMGQPASHEHILFECPGTGNALQDIRVARTHTKEDLIMAGLSPPLRPLPHGPTPQSKPSSPIPAGFGRLFPHAYPNPDLESSLHLAACPEAGRYHMSISKKGCVTIYPGGTPTLALHVYGSQNSGAYTLPII